MTDTKTELETMLARIACTIESGFPEHGTEDTEDDYGRVLDFLEGVLDFQWIVASDRQTMLGCRLLVAFGGPNIWIDTGRGVIEGAWWSSSTVHPYMTDSDGARLLEEALMNLWEC